MHRSLLEPLTMAALAGIAGSHRCQKMSPEEIADLAFGIAKATSAKLAQELDDFEELTHQAPDE